jgi:hypothetical protein
MTQSSDFYDDVDFMIALFFNRMLNNADIYEIANRLNNKTSDDVLAKIIANGTGVNNKRLFNNFLNAVGIEFVDTKRAIVAKVFYYILHGRIKTPAGIRFLKSYVSNRENVTKYAGDDIGIEQILGNYYGIDDRIGGFLLKSGEEHSDADKEILDSIYEIGRTIIKGDPKMTAANEENIEILKKAVKEEMEQYIHDNLIHFPMDNNISKDKTK